MSIQVLIVEPDRSLLDSYRTYLVRQGFEVLTAASGPDAMASLMRHTPHVLVLEPDLPNGWGNKLLERMRDDSEVPCVPVVVLTRRDFEQLEHPVRAYYVKPYSMTRLARVIRSAAEEGEELSVISCQ